MGNLKNAVVKCITKEAQLKKEAEEKIKTFLSDKVLSISPNLLKSLAKIENVDKYDLDFSVTEDSYIEYGLKVVNYGNDNFEIVGEIYNAKIDGFIICYNKETDTEEEIEVSIPLNLEDVSFDIYAKNNYMKLVTIEVEDNGGLIITFIG